MRICSYCGAQYSDDVLVCSADQTSLVDKPTPRPTVSTARPEPGQVSHRVLPMSPGDESRDFVTLVRCGTLVSADMVVSRLRAGGIDAFIPDECLMQTIGFNLNTFGYVRVQVTPKDYERAKALLEQPGAGA